MCTQFVEDDKYAELIVAKIPKRKVYEMLIEIYRKKADCKIYNIQRFFRAIFQRLSDNEIHQFLGTISSDLQKTNDDNERKFILRCFPKERWNEVDEISRLRTENRIIKSIEDGIAYEYKKTTDGWLATWCTHLFSEFTLTGKLISTIGGKISSSDIPQIKYCMKFMLETFWKILDVNQLNRIEEADKDPFEAKFDYWFISSVKREIENGNKLFYSYCKEKSFQIPEQIRKYLESAIDEFHENEDIKTIVDDDQPDDFEDDIPF